MLRRCCVPFQGCAMFLVLALLPLYNPATHHGNAQPREVDEARDLPGMQQEGLPQSMCYMLGSLPQPMWTRPPICNPLFTSSPCTNHPVRCPLCTKTVWSYCMAQHYADVHDTARHPDLMHIAEAEQEAVLNWVPHKAKKKN